MKKVCKTTNENRRQLRAKFKTKTAERLHLQSAFDAFQRGEDKALFLRALRDIIELRDGVGWLFKETQINREYLYYILSGKCDTRFDTFCSIINALGVSLRIGTS